MKFFTGTSGFGHKEWKGSFYPEKIADKKLLGFYATRLRSVEINNTFYHMPTKTMLLSWSEQVPDDFVFSFKAPQVITHLKRLLNVFEETEYLFSTLSSIDEKLGPVLFQFPKSFRADRDLLKDFLSLLPAGVACAFDFRSPTWFSQEIFDMLREKGCSLCIEDTDEAPAESIISTASWGYIRLRRSDYTEADLSAWLEKVRQQRWKKVFVYFKHEEGPEMAMRFRSLAEA